MPILNYTTSISVDKTIGEIQKVLVYHGAHKIVCDYSDALPIAVTFCLNMDGQTIAFALPCNYEGVLNAMMASSKVPRSKCTPEQAMRVGWRIVKDWVEAQMALVEAKLADAVEVFLPYALTNGTTVYKQLKENKFKQLTAGE